MESMEIDPNFRSLYYSPAGCLLLIYATRILALALLLRLLLLLLFCRGVR